MSIVRPGKRKPVILLAFANEHDKRRLVRLQDERRAIRDALDPLKDYFEIIEEPTATLDDITRTLTKYGDRLTLFHFAGHASPESLQLETRDAGSTSIYARGFAELLSCRRIPELVFLNGCSSASQAQTLIDNGVRCVIGTLAAIGDDVAAKMASLFYQNLATGASIGDAYQLVEKHFSAAFGTDHSRAYRDVYMDDKPVTGWPWTLEVLAGQERSAEQLTLSQLTQPEESAPASTLLGFMCDRKAQIKTFFRDALPNHLEERSGRPLGIIVHGVKDEGHNEFLERIEKWDLPRYLGERLNIHRPVKTITVDWDDDVNDLSANLAYECTRTDSASLDEVQQAIVEMRMPVIVRTTIAPKQWRDSTPDVIDQWLALFARFADLPRGQMLLPVILVCEDTAGINKWMFWRNTPAKYFRHYKSPDGIAALPLPRLESVCEDEVVLDWLTRDFKTQLAACTDRGQDADTLARQLKPFVQGLYDATEKDALPMDELGYPLSLRIADLLTKTR